MSKHFVGKTNTAESEKDVWQTPGELFYNLDCEFSFDVDVCASDENALCNYHFTEGNSALIYNWDEAFN